uniref:stress-associated endoplasmic reticulum protein 2-like n=1 Tax=Erigeron canadensis TaxID=72917 RepID=UPI001CB99DC8
CYEYTTSRRLANKKAGKLEKNITRRGSVPETSTKNRTSKPVGTAMLCFFVFVVIGSSLFQIINTATSGKDLKINNNFTNSSTI